MYLPALQTPKGGPGSPKILIRCLVYQMLAEEEEEVGGGCLYMSRIGALHVTCVCVWTRSWGFLRRRRSQAGWIPRCFPDNSSALDGDADAGAGAGAQFGDSSYLIYSFIYFFADSHQRGAAEMVRLRRQFSDP